MTATTTFDPVAYKETTRRQWNAAARAWNDWGPFLRAWLGPATEAALDLARVGPGSRVLIVAAGAGDEALQTADRVGPAGYVLATDIAADIIAFAAANARRLGYANVETGVMDGEQLEVPTSSFDAALSRLGLIFFPDQQKGLADIKRALKPGGRVALIGYSTPDRNPFFSIPVGIVRRHANLPPPGPGQPGPFSLGGPGMMVEALRSAGLTELESRTVAAPLRLSSAAECTRFERESFGALHQMLSGLDEAGRAAAWREIEQELRAFDGPDGFVGPCELVVAAGTA
jgi:SAM-dependent methyltransferase